MDRVRWTPVGHGACSSLYTQLHVAVRCLAPRRLRRCRRRASSGQTQTRPNASRPLPASGTVDEALLQCTVQGLLPLLLRPTRASSLSASAPLREIGDSSSKSSNVFGNRSRERRYREERRPLAHRHVRRAGKGLARGLTLRRRGTGNDRRNLPTVRSPGPGPPQPSADGRRGSGARSAALRGEGSVGPGTPQGARAR